MTLTARSYVIASTLVLASLLGACASKVPLTDPATVEDKSGQPTQTNQGNQSANTGGSNTVGVRDVKPVTAETDNTAANGGIVYFDFDSSSIKPEFQALIEGQVKRMSANRALKASLAGHTDEMGGREYNLALGQKRAEAVKRAMSILGVQESQLEAVSFGKEKPAMAGNSDAAGAKNRRVEVMVR